MNSLVIQDLDYVCMITALSNCKDLKIVYCDVRHIKAWLVTILLLGIIYYPILFHFRFRYILYIIHSIHTLTMICYHNNEFIIRILYITQK